MKIEYEFESVALPELVISTKGRPNPGDELVNSVTQTAAASFIVEKVEANRIAVKIPGSEDTVFLAWNCLTDAQWSKRFDYGKTPVAIGQLRAIVVDAN